MLIYRHIYNSIQIEVIKTFMEKNNFHLGSIQFSHRFKTILTKKVFRSTPRSNG